TMAFSAKAVVLATGGAGKSWKYTSNSWECTGDGHAMALWAGADLIDMECVQFHPTGMVWPVSVRGLLVTEGVRGDGGVLRNSQGHRFTFDYVADMFRAETADSEEEADRWYEDHSAGRRPPELLPRDEVARAINTEVKSGRGSAHGGVFLDIASRRSSEYIRRRLPSMYHQFMELAGVDITKEAMEVAPTCHYIMGGVRVDADTAAATVPGLFVAGETAGGMHGSNRLGGNSLSDLLVFGRRAGKAAADLASGRARPDLDWTEIDAIEQESRSPLGRQGGENPYDVHHDLQETMQSLVGIIRNGDDLDLALERLEELSARAQKLSVGGGPAYNPAWNLATDLPAMLAVSLCVTLGARERKESRGGHTREDYPRADPELGKVNLVQRQLSGGGTQAEIKVTPEPIPQLPEELERLFEEDH
ncbi:MAG: FAD-binding protein, partial [Acidimicrobiales bacterium]